MAGKPGPRSNQQRRTRRTLLDAAARLMRQGNKPTLEQVAAEALVSRATAYRYFPSAEALLAEASLDMGSPDPAVLFKGLSANDTVERLDRVEDALHRLIAENDVAMRVMLANTLQQGLSGDSITPRRQNRRTPLIEAALEPAKNQFTAKSRDLLAKALALIVGTEAEVVFQDVLQLSGAEARKIKRFAIRALVDAARKEAR